MSPRLHAILCAAICAAGASAAVAVALDGSPAGAVVLTSSAYILSALGHYSLLVTVAEANEEAPRRVMLIWAVMAAAWPALDLWLCAISLLPSARAPEARQ